MSKDRRLLAQILKSWAQEHHTGYQIMDPNPDEQGIINTGSYLSWVVREADTSLNFLSLLDKLDKFMNNKKKYDGMFCKQCRLFSQFAEPNQDDGTMICYSCRQNPYR
jgi:hypothetical protein